MNDKISAIISTMNSTINQEDSLEHDGHGIEFTKESHDGMKETFIKNEEEVMKFVYSLQDADDVGFSEGEENLLLDIAVSTNSNDDGDFDIVILTPLVNTEEVHKNDDNLLLTPFSNIEEFDATEFQINTEKKKFISTEDINSVGLQIDYLSHISNTNHQILLLGYNFTYYETEHHLFISNHPT